MYMYMMSLHYDLFYVSLQILIDILGLALDWQWKDYLVSDEPHTPATPPASQPHYTVTDMYMYILYTLMYACSVSLLPHFLGLYIHVRKIRNEILHLTEE